MLSLRNVCFQMKHHTTVLAFLKGEIGFASMIISFTAITAIGHILSRTNSFKGKILPT